MIGWKIFFKSIQKEVIHRVWALLHWKKYFKTGLSKFPCKKVPSVWQNLQHFHSPRLPYFEWWNFHETLTKNTISKMVSWEMTEMTNWNNVLMHVGHSTVWISSISVEMTSWNEKFSHVTGQNFILANMTKLCKIIYADVSIQRSERNFHNPKSEYTEIARPWKIKLSFESIAAESFAFFST